MKQIFTSCLLIIATTCLFAQQTSVLTWQRTLETASASVEDVYEKCPHFPKLEQYSSDTEFDQSLKLWEESYPEEVIGFWNLPAIKEANPSPFYLGLELYEPKVYTNSFIQWIESSRISENRLRNIAPNFPKDASNEDLDWELERWQQLYGHEYEALINDRQLTALNPYYEGYADIIQIPKFISALVSEEQPTFYDSGNPAKDKLRHDLQMQNWYFVFQPNQFEEVYGFYPEFPEWFDENNYRNLIKERIKANEEAKAKGLTDPNEAK